MKLQVVSCNHHTADLAVRERLAFAGAEQLAAACRAFRSRFTQSEIVIVSTCNRVEVYAAHEDEQTWPSHLQIAQLLSEIHHVPLDDFVDGIHSESGPAAVRHLFEVTSSLDSMVLGEPQIVSQIKDAYRVAQESEACGPLTHALFEAAIRVSKRVRSETRLAEGRVSIASVAVGDFGKGIFDRFDDKFVLVIGAGEMAEETLRYLKDEGVREIAVINRNLERAQRLAERWGGHAHPLVELNHWLAQADVVVSTTGAEQPVVTVEAFREVRRRANHKPVFILDLGAPRDFDPAINDAFDNVYLYDIDSLETTCRNNRAARVKEIERARAIIDEETDRFMHDFYHRATGPVIRRLRDEWHAIRRAELEQLFARLEHLGDKDRLAIERSVERIINKLLHPPLEVLRDEAREGTPHGLLDALKRLFHLHD